jgi:hypothetical protein
MYSTDLRKEARNGPLPEVYRASIVRTTARLHPCENLLFTLTHIGYTACTSATLVNPVQPVCLGATEPKWGFVKPLSAGVALLLVQL